MGYYYHDPSGLGIWFVPDGQTPAQAIADIQDQTGVVLSPILQYSIQSTPAAQKIGGGNPSPSNTTSPPPPQGYSNQGASVIPTVAPLTQDQISRMVKPRIVADNPDDPNSPSYQCDTGYYWDDFNQACVPFSTGTAGAGGPVTIGATQQGANNVEVIVNNAVTLSSGVGQTIANAVATGVQDAVDQAKAAAADAAQAVEDGIQQTIDAVSTTATNLISDLKQALTWIGNLIQQNLGALISFVTQNIGKIISAVGDAVSAISNVVTNVIAPAIQSINNVVNNTIAPIFNTISQVYQQTNALITAIQKDVSNGITGILQLPSDISNALTGIIGDIDRALGAIGLKTTTGTSVFVGPDGQDSIWTRLQGIGVNITSVTGHDQVNTTFTDHVKLPEPTITQAGSATFDAVFAEIKDFVLSLMHGGQSSIDAVKSATSLVPFLLGSVAELPASIVLIAGGFVAGMLPLFEFLSGDIRSKAGLEKLPPSEALAAALRGFIDSTTLQQELAFRGYDAQRIQILTDLQKYLIDNDKILDMWFRGIVSDADRDANLNAHGVTAADSKALVEGAYRLVEVNLARTARRWNIIDDTAFDAVLKQNRYTDNEIALEHSTLFSHEGVDDVIGRERRELLYSGLGYSPEGFSTPSADTLAAASRDGVDAATALDRWQSSYYVLPLQEWIIGYYRNLVTLRELNAAMDYYRVPSPQRDLLINTRRSLIPWRTIPTMVANGILDSSTAGNILQQHGFDLPSTEALLKYAELTKPKSKVLPSVDIQGLSLQTARGYFDSGTIGSEEYKAVLLVHGYDDQTASLQVKVETQHAAMLARKQLASDIVAEAKAGVITVDQAVAQMESNQFSVAEKSNVLNRINGVKRQTVKRPSEAELHSMVRASAISIDTYRQTLSQDGWAQSWVDAFVNWRFPSAASNTSAA